MIRVLHGFALASKTIFQFQIKRIGNMNLIITLINKYGALKTIKSFTHRIKTIKSQFND